MEAGGKDRFELCSAIVIPELKSMAQKEIDAFANAGLFLKEFTAS